MCKHEWQPVEVSFQKIEAVMCIHCGRVERKVKVTIERNPDFPWEWYADVQARARWNNK